MARQPDPERELQVARYLFGGRTLPPTAREWITRARSTPICQSGNSGWTSPGW
jgi:hypothetical protein